MNVHDLIFFTFIVCITAIGIAGMIITGKILLKEPPKRKVIYIITYPLGTTVQRDGSTVHNSELAEKVLEAIREGRNIACSFDSGKLYRLTAMDCETGEIISERYLDP